MKILKSWLKDYVDIKVSNQELADKLSLAGNSVESFEENLDKNVVIAEIKEVLPHPNADRLQIAKVFDGKNTLTIVCGAKNIAAGQKVPLAKVGAMLPGNFEIKRAKIRDIESEGMLCASDELGLGEDHSGIIILPNDSKVGEPLNSIIESDAVIDIEVTPNRGDTLSHLGIAREVSVITGAELKKIKLGKLNQSVNDKIKTIEITNKEKCFRYFGIEIRGVKIAPSPDWLKQRLEAVGLKSINNVVDVTNYVMMDLGQPLHAFDLKKLEGDKILIRNAEPNENIVTIDNEKRALNPADLVIADESKAVALAGIMGGINSEIDENTCDVFLEAAEFEPVTVRKTANRLGILSEAKYRFERGIDSGLVSSALYKAAIMIEELAGGELGKVISDDTPLIKIEFKFDHDQIASYLNLPLKSEHIDKILRGLGFVINEDVCFVPSWRHDVSIWYDLAEEVGRIYGYNNIPRDEVRKDSKPPKSRYYYKEYLKDQLVGLGLVEVMNYSFLSETDLIAAQINATDLLEVANPVQPENKYLRKSLVPGLLKAVAKNPTFDVVGIFEIANVFSKEGENTMLGIAVSGKNAKDIFEQTCSKIEQISTIKKEELAIIEHSREELNRFKIKKPVTYTFEVNLDSLIANSKLQENQLELTISDKKIHYRPISKFPPVTRDLAFVLDKNIAAEDVIETIYQLSDLINRVELFDEFVSDKFGQGNKNLAFHLYLSHADRTLTDQEANVVIKDIIESIEQKYKAKLRS